MEPIIGRHVNVKDLIDNARKTMSNGISLTSNILADNQVQNKVIKNTFNMHDYTAYTLLTRTMIVGASSALQLASKEVLLKNKIDIENFKSNSSFKIFHNPETLTMLKESFSEIKIGINRKIKQMRQQKEKIVNDKTHMNIY